MSKVSFPFNGKVAVNLTNRPMTEEERRLLRADVEGASIRYQEIGQALARKGLIVSKQALTGASEEKILEALGEFNGSGIVSEVEGLTQLMHQVALGGYWYSRLRNAE